MAKKNKDTVDIEQYHNVRILLIGLAIVLVIAHGANLFQVDTVSIALLLFIALMVFLPYIESIDLPGGGKLTFKERVKEIQKLGESIIQSKKFVRAGVDEWELRLFTIAEEDPNLALAGLRMQLEDKLRKLAKKAEIKDADRLSLRKLLMEIQGTAVLMHGQVYFLFDSLVDATNKAVHGQKVEREDALRLLDTGVNLIHYLEQEIKSK